MAVSVLPYIQFKTGVKLSRVLKTKKLIKDKHETTN
jgi:hypothetical protein